MKVKSFAVTFRPIDGVSECQISTMEKWVRKKCRYYHLITEKTGLDRHIHCGMILQEESTLSNLKTTLSRLFKELSGPEVRVFRQGIKVMYNIDFIKNYLDKNDDTVVIASNLPEVSHLESFFEPIPVAVPVKKEKHSSYYVVLEGLWLKHVSPSVEVNTRTTRDFLFDMMYAQRLINVIADDRKIIQVARHLTRFLKRSTQSTIELPPFENEE